MVRHKEGKCKQSRISAFVVGYIAWWTESWTFVAFVASRSCRTDMHRQAHLSTMTENTDPMCLENGIQGTSTNCSGLTIIKHAHNLHTFTIKNAATEFRQVKVLKRTVTVFKNDYTLNTLHSIVKLLSCFIDMYSFINHSQCALQNKENKWYYSHSPGGEYGAILNYKNSINGQTKDMRYQDSGWQCLHK